MAPVEHLGSLLRGCLGHALRALACRCPGDNHADHCQYQNIFKPPHPAHLAERYGDIPPAFVITPPPAWDGGQQGFRFGFTLFGPALAQRELLLGAWQLAGRSGFDPGKVRAVIRLVAAQRLPALPAQRAWLELELLSPLFLKRGGEPLPAAQLRAHDVVLALARRLRLLDQLHNLLPAEADPRIWVEQSASLRLHLQAAEVNYRRYSNRQHRSMPLQGITGHLHLKGPVSPGLADAFALGQWLHLGGKTSLGLGAYRLLEESTGDTGRGH